MDFLFPSEIHSTHIILGRSSCTTGVSELDPYMKKMAFDCSQILVEKLIQAANREKNNPHFFSDVLVNLGRHCYFLAVKMKLPNAGLYGIPRDAPPYDNHQKIDPADPSYVRYNAEWLKNIEGFIKTLVSNSSEPLEKLIRQLDFNRTYSLKSDGCHVSQCNLTVYDQWNVPKFLSDCYVINDSFLPLEYLYLHVENFLEVNGVLTTLSQHLVRFDFFPRKENCILPTQQEVMLSGLSGQLIQMCPTLAIQQNHSLCQGIYLDMDKIVHQILNLDPMLDRKQLIDLIGLFRYEFAYLCPFILGNKMVLDWIETAIYRYFGWDSFSQSLDDLYDVEALSSLTLEDYISKYRLQITDKLQ